MDEEQLNQLQKSVEEIEVFLGLRDKERPFRGNKLIQDSFNVEERLALTKQSIADWTAIYNSNDIEFRCSLDNNVIQYASKEMLPALWGVVKGRIAFLEEYKQRLEQIVEKKKC